MAHDHGHGHHHGHSHAPANFGMAFAIGVTLNLVYVVAEVVFGLLAHSLALVADAGHNLGDVLGLALAWGASVLARRGPTPTRTYGLRRTTVLAALINAVTLLATSGAIAWEALRRLRDPDPVTGTTVIWVALLGIVINGGTAVLFASGRHRDLNIRGAFLHMAADAGLTAGVVVAGVAILLTGWLWIDPVASLILVAVIVDSTWGLLRDSVNLALDAVPEGIDSEAVQDYLASLPEVSSVHDLHIWGMSTTEVALTAHLVMPERTSGDALLARVCEELHDRFGIEHATLQVEHGDPAYACPLV